MVETVRSTDGTPIACEQTGTGPALVLTVGALCSRRSIDTLVSQLQDGFTVYSYDRRGRGDSGNTAPYSVDREVEDLHAVLDAAGGTAYLYGHSSGGILALYAAEDTPGFTKVAVYEPPFCTEAKPGFAEHLDKLLAEGRRDDAVADWMRNTGAPFDEEWKYAPFWPTLIALADTLPYDLALTRDATVPAQRFAHIAADTVAFYGGESPAWALKSATAVATAIAGARIEAIPGQGHPVAHEVIVPVLVDFFKQ
ncbi:alpha/beta fold hydrolase [Arthrobacter sp. A5]|uniref:alpha/beta fold hydrolase n=1 Tax=Arthrobacter sp. A5 TaxID=576926 RepID=UPI003DA82F59